jgi:hypothetical protein
MLVQNDEVKKRITFLFTVKHLPIAEETKFFFSLTSRLKKFFKKIHKHLCGCSLLVSYSFLIMSASQLQTTMFSKRSDCLLSYIAMLHELLR